LNFLCYQLVSEPESKSIWRRFEQFLRIFESFWKSQDLIDFGVLDQIDWRFVFRLLRFFIKDWIGSINFKVWIKICEIDEIFGFSRKFRVVIQKCVKKWFSNKMFFYKVVQSMISSRSANFQSIWIIFEWDIEFWKFLVRASLVQKKPLVTVKNRYRIPTVTVFVDIKIVTYFAVTFDTLLVTFIKCYQIS
jgi:hypothetical protein